MGYSTHRLLSLKSRATKETAAWIWLQMQSGEWAWLPKGVRKTQANHSDGIVVVDQWGNMAAPDPTTPASLVGGAGE